MSESPDLAKHLCSRCTVLCVGNVVVPLCKRCRRLVDSGECRGPMPTYLIPLGTAAECPRCGRWWPIASKEAPDDGSDVRWCAKHRDLAIKRTPSIPLEYDRPQVPHLVALYETQLARNWFP
jgi:hypothetical protein